MRVILTKDTKINSNIRKKDTELFVTNEKGKELIDAGNARQLGKLKAKTGQSKQPDKK